MKVLFNEAVVQKKNSLNEMHNFDMNFQELRLFLIYLSKINPQDISTRTVRFTLEEYVDLLGIKKINVQTIRTSLDSFLHKIIEIPTESGGFRRFCAFQECALDKDSNGDWFIELNAHEKALPIFFNYKNKFVTYKLKNILNLKTTIHIRMYELLKQYESLGKRTMEIEELRSFLGIKESEYARFQNFKEKVLDSCQKALSEHTDICFTYERGKSGRGGKWLSIQFNIFKNPKFSKPDIIECECADNATPEIKNEELDYGSELGDLLASVCDYEFEPEQIRILQDLVLNATGSHDHMLLADYLLHKYHVMNFYDKNSQISNRFTYLQSVIKTDIQEGSLL